MSGLQIHVYLVKLLSSLNLSTLEYAKHLATAFLALEISSASGNGNTYQDYCLLKFHNFFLCQFIFSESILPLLTALITLSSRYRHRCCHKHLCTVQIFRTSLRTAHFLFSSLGSHSSSLRLKIRLLSTSIRSQ